MFLGGAIKGICGGSLGDLYVKAPGIFQAIFKAPRSPQEQITQSTFPDGHASLASIENTKRFASHPVSLQVFCVVFCWRGGSF